VPPAVITYLRDHRFDLAPEVLWERIGDFGSFESWWPWLTDLQVEGVGLTQGTILYGVVTPPLPYRMELRIAFTNVRRPRSIDAAISGDLVGDAHLELRTDGDMTCVQVSWSMEMLQPAMKLANRFARPLLVWGHDRVVDMTVAGFRRGIAASR
jgi:hypothetical protein